jgi:hypothetical protein
VLAVTSAAGAGAGAVTCAAGECAGAGAVTSAANAGAGAVTCDLPCPSSISFSPFLFLF